MKTIRYIFGNTLLLSFLMLALPTGSAFAETVYSLRGTVELAEFV